MREEYFDKLKFIGQKLVFRIVAINRLLSILEHLINTNSN